MISNFDLSLSSFRVKGVGQLFPEILGDQTLHSWELMLPKCAAEVIWKYTVYVHNEGDT